MGGSVVDERRSKDEPRKHHFLPQFYLRGFSANGKSICQIEKDGARGYLCSIRDVAAIRDYHADPAYEDPYVVEKRLRGVEDRLSRVLVSVLECGITTPEAHAGLVQLVSLMRFRVPAFKAHVEESLRAVVRSTGKIMERRGALPPVPKGLENVLRMDRLSISISNWKCLEIMFAQAADPRVLHILASMRPSVLRVPEGAFLLTCDQPVAVYHPNASPTDTYGTGLIDPATEISFPLSSRALLRLAWSSDAPEDRLLTSAELEEFNRRTIVMAEALVFAPTRSESAESAVARYGHCSAGIDFQVLDTRRGALHLSRFRPVMRADRYAADLPAEG